MIRESHIEAIDGLMLWHVLWVPPGSVSAVIVLVHGIGEHTGRYTHVAEKMNTRGFAFSACDLRGHGRSEGPRGHFPDYGLIMDDIGSMLSSAEASFPGVPLFLFGHSMGGNLVLNYALRRKPDLAGVISSAPLLRLAEEPPSWKKAAGEIMRRVCPKVSISNGIRSRDLSRDPEIGSAYDADPLVHDRVTPSFLDIRRAGIYALSHAERWTLPLLLMHGDADRMTSHLASEEFAEKAGAGVDLRIWNGFFHELHNEPEKNEVLDFIGDWIERQRRKTSVL